MDITNNKPKNNKKHPFERLKRWFKLTYLKILRLDDPPERIARGAAIGVLMGVLPTFGAGGFLSIGFAFIFKANKAAAVIGSFIVNPLTAPFFWTLSIAIGSVIMGEDRASIITMIRSEGFLKAGGWAYLVYMAGNVVISALCTAGAYFAVKRAIIRHRKHKEAKRLAKTGSGSF
ncbi:MAG: DUF2062 domain-containing protein [Deltaproteobacteria bacterium]|nr:DUF2062 domain-containing protein [Deltaproteobacteria bacterium]